MENVSLHRIKSKTCSKCEVPPEKLGSGTNHYCPRDYTRYECYEFEIPALNCETHDTARALYTNDIYGIKRVQNVFVGLVRVSTPDLHKPDML